MSEIEYKIRTPLFRSILGSILFVLGMRSKTIMAMMTIFDHGTSNQRSIGPTRYRFENDCRVKMQNWQ